jgi:hypothetical protein
VANSTQIIPSPIARRQSMAASVQKLPDSAVKPVSRARHRLDVSGESIRFSSSLRLTVVCSHVMCIKDKQMLVFNFVLDLWSGGGSSVSSVAFLGSCQLK